MDNKELREQIKRDDVKYISLQFVDVIGSVKSVDMPIEQLDGALNNGVWFDGSSVEGFARIQESDMYLKLDIDTYTVLPWSPEEMRRARIFCDIYSQDGTPFEGDPRGKLKSYLKELKDKRGWTFMTGPEPEFFLFKRNNGNGENIHPVPHDVGGYFDFSPNDDAVRVRTELMAALRTMGLEIELGHHEVALGQHEIDFRFADALKTADNVLTLKYTVKAIAAQHQLIASFMPKPVYGINGSGMHVHESMHDVEGNNIFYDANDEINLSKIAYGCIEGQLRHARALAAIASPTVNSYKRLVPGYEAPVYVGWAQQNRSALIRIPRHTPGMHKATRMEVRFPDPAANPYLTFIALLAASLDGVDNPGTLAAPLNNINVYEMKEEEKVAAGITELPGSLNEALNALEQDEVIQNALGPILYKVFMRAKREEWEQYRTHVMDWEVERYLEKA
ncbi:MAG: type I glutamate--ammonia ligase [Anaerolineaceae bacterium]|nr:type I glutamate--ammonia ligase [Anaerolineaceae bacterium]